MNGRGCIPDPAGHMRTPARHLIGSTPATLLRSASLEHVAASISNQEQTNSCVGHGMSGAIQTRFAHLGIIIARPSQSGIYTLARCLDRVPGTPLVDAGTMMNQATRAIGEWGISSDTLWPFDPTTINREPHLDELESLDVQLDGVYGAPDGDVGAVCHSIASGFPVLFAVPKVDQLFEDYAAGRAPLKAPDARAPDGGHCLYGVGYDMTASGRLMFRFANSWGIEWGDAGFGEGDESFVRALISINLMNLSMKGGSR